MFLLSSILFAAALGVLGVAAFRGLRRIDEILDVAGPSPADAEG